MSLTKEQQVAFDKLNKFVNTYDTNYFVLQGYAGTGKTYLIDKFVDKWNKKRKIVITAPTHKALKVLRANAGDKYNVEFRTIHSLLGLKEKIDANGNVSFVQDYDSEIDVDSYDIVIIDEASMVQDELLLGGKDMSGLFSYIELYEVKVIFVGDPAQIPPINKKDALPFDSKWQREYKAEVSVLENIVRQAKGNPIIELTMQVRENLLRPTILPLRKNKVREDGTGVWFYGFEDKKEFMDNLKKYFISDEFDRDSDYAKVIAWRNKTVNGFNKLIRSFRYTDNKKIHIGEKLIANTPIFDFFEGIEKIIFNTNDEFVVNTLDIGYIDWNGIKLKVYLAEVKTDTGYKRKIKILHEDSEEDYNTILEYLVDAAKAEKRGSFQAVTKWQQFYRFKRELADVNYNYCITAHKSQGSTYENAFVIESDIDANNRIYERNRIKYTAFSRPSKRLFIID